MRISLFCGVAKESAIDAGKKVGMDEEALGRFAYVGYEHKITYEVNPATGEGEVVAIDDKELKETKAT